MPQDRVRDGRDLMENDERGQGVSMRFIKHWRPRPLPDYLFYVQPEFVGRMTDEGFTPAADIPAADHPNYRYQQRTGEEGV